MRISHLIRQYNSNLVESGIVYNDNSSILGKHAAFWELSLDEGMSYVN